MSGRVFTSRGLETALILSNRDNRQMDRINSIRNPDAECERMTLEHSHKIFKRKMRLIRRIWVMSIFLFVVLAIEVTTAFFTSPRFQIYRIKVAPMETISTAEIIQRMALPENSNYCRVSVKKLASLIAEDPRVAHVQVTRGNVGVLHVAVQEREPVCQLGYTIPPLYMDAAGYIFQRNRLPAKALIIVEGVKLPRYDKVIGHRLKNENLATIRLIITKFHLISNERILNVARIIVDNQGWVTLVLQQGTKVFLGDITKSNIDQKSWYIDKAIIAASEKGFTLADLEFIDIRYVVASTGMGIRYHPKTRN